MVPDVMRVGDASVARLEMKKKRHAPELIIKKLRAIELMVGQGRTAAEASKVESISEQTYYTDGRSNMQGWTSSA